MTSRALRPVSTGLPTSRPLSPARPSLPALVVCLAIALLATACGGDEPSGIPKRPAAGGGAAKPIADLKIGPNLDDYTVLGENPRWKPIEGIYQDYASLDMNALANPVVPNLVTFVEMPIIDRPTDTAGTQIQPEAAKCEAGSEFDPQLGKCVAVDDGAPDPRRLHPVEEYKLIILMTGTTRPKAVVVSPDGVRFDLTRGDPLGEEGGRVQAVLQYRVLVSVPGKKEPFALSIEPPLGEFQDDEEAEDELADELGT